MIVMLFTTYESNTLSCHVFFSISFLMMWTLDQQSPPMPHIYEELLRSTSGGCYLIKNLHGLHFLPASSPQTTSQTHRAPAGFFHRAVLFTSHTVLPQDAGRVHRGRGFSWATPTAAERLFLCRVDHVDGILPEAIEDLRRVGEICGVAGRW